MEEIIKMIALLQNENIICALQNKQRNILGWSISLAVIG